MDNGMISKAQLFFDVQIILGSYINWISLFLAFCLLLCHSSSLSFSFFHSSLTLSLSSIPLLLLSSPLLCFPLLCSLSPHTNKHKHNVTRTAYCKCCLHFQACAFSLPLCPDIHIGNIYVQKLNYVYYNLLLVCK